jgi:hypothetical protein
VVGIRRKGPYRRWLGEGAFIDYELLRNKKEILKYTVQLTLEVRGVWVAAIRYDVAHGKPHKHVYRSDGGERTLPVDSTYDSDLGYSQAMSAAMKDVRENWRTYHRRFRGGEWAT